MKRARKNWLIRLCVFIGGIFSLRLLSYFMHLTTLEKMYKPRDFRKTNHPELSPNIINQLPSYCQTIFGRKMDPINLLFIGTETGIRRAFEKAGWNGAHPPTPLHVAFGLGCGFFNRTYHHGPFMPLYVNIGTQDLSFQKVMTRGYGRRHHIRVWRTRYALSNNNWLWVAACTFDDSFKVSFYPPFVYHHKQANLDIERDFIVSMLAKQGHALAGEYQINKATSSEVPVRDVVTGNHYFTDGKAAAIEIT